MSILAKLIHQSNMTFIPTKLPVKFFGMPDGKVYMVYARFCKQQPDKTDLEFVLAEHEEFSYDYPSGTLVPKCVSRYPVYSEMVDKPNPAFHILQVSRDIKSYSEAVESLHQKAKDMVPEPVMC
jgi:hypothetical protein